MGKRKRTHQETELFYITPDEFDGERISAFSTGISGHGRRVVRHSETFYRPAPLSGLATSSSLADGPPTSSHDAHHENDGPAIEDDLGEEHTLKANHTSRRGKSGTSFATLVHDPVMLSWAGERDSFLKEILRLEGLRGAHADYCGRCKQHGKSKAVYLCRDCFSQGPVCRSCCLDAHESQPFHRIKLWNGRHLEHTTLQNIGLVLQLGHPPSEKCPSPVPAPRGFMVIDTTGFHGVTLQFCQCDKMHRAGTRTQQLLRSELYGATLHDPTTCCTFRVLEHFHITTLQSKINAYDYYMSLEKLTNNGSLMKQPARMKPFLRIVRQFRNLKVLKRAGRGHEPGGVAATKEGELCVVCPACPRPGVNLPNNWKETSDDLKYIYTLFIAVDANFRLKRRAISNEVRDPALGSGWGYFVEDGKYRNHLKAYVAQDEISTCTGLAALLQANTKFSKGYTTTGVGMACCSRHGFVLPNGVGDTQNGEKYCNMDYIIMSALKLLPDKLVKLISYDIICQWVKNLLQRVANFPQHLFADIPLDNLRYAIPKYHFRAHKELDHNKYSLNLIKGSGRTDGEEIERNWTHHDETSGSTREMGPGSRHDTLEDHFGWANWQRLTRLGDILRDRLIKATREQKVYQSLYDDFTGEIPREKLDEWIRQVVAWENDFSQPDPYFIPPSGMTEADIRYQLAQDDEKDVTNGNPTLHTVTPAALIMELLDIESQQRRFQQKYGSIRSNATPSQMTELVEKRTALWRRLAGVRAIQAIYMPWVPALIAGHTQSLLAARRPADAIEDEPLFLPSGVGDNALDACEAGLADIENKLRDGQLRDSLDKLRVQLHIKARLINFKARNARRQMACTRSNHKIHENEKKIKEYGAKYRAARQAKLALVGQGDWEHEWRELKAGDDRCMQEDDPTASRCVSEGRRTISWIWLASGDRRHGEEAAHLPGMDDALRVEFLRARARACRFSEEVQLLKEEQRRVLVSLEQTALTWNRREGDAQKIEDAILGQGVAAYAARQAALQRALACKFKGMWKNLDAGDTGEPRQSGTVEGEEISEQAQDGMEGNDGGDNGGDDDGGDDNGELAFILIDDLVDGDEHGEMGDVPSDDDA